MSSIHELLKQVYPLNLRMELFNAIWTGWREDIKEKDQRIAELEEQLKNATKQVRKEVCNDFKSRFLATCQIEKGCDTASFSLEVLNRILDQIQDKGEKE